MANEINVPLIEEPITLNYAVTCTVLKLEEDAKIHLVDYRASKNEIQKRLPGGRFQAIDLIQAVESAMKKNDSRELQFLHMDASRLKNSFDVESTSIEDFKILNELFNSFTEKLLTRLQSCKITEDEFSKILSETHRNTVRRELREEIGASNFGEIILSSVNNALDPHIKLGFTSVEVEAPSYYQGSPDPKIIRSYEKVIDENIAKSLWNGHSNNFQEGLRCIIQNKKPGYQKLQKYLTASK